MEVFDPQNLVGVNTIVVGKSGCGKTVLVNAIMDFIQHDLQLIYKKSGIDRLLIFVNIVYCIYKKVG